MVKSHKILTVYLGWDLNSTTCQSCGLWQSISVTIRLRPLNIEGNSWRICVCKTWCSDNDCEVETDTVLIVGSQQHNFSQSYLDGTPRWLITASGNVMLWFCSQEELRTNNVWESLNCFQVILAISQSFGWDAFRKTQDGWILTMAKAHIHKTSENGRQKKMWRKAGLSKRICCPVAENSLTAAQAALGQWRYLLKSLGQKYFEHRISY